MRKTILVVDDEPLIRKQLSVILEKYGFNCFLAGSTREAKQILQKETIDLATVDIIMPGDNGIELTKWIKLNFSTPVIMVTSLDDNIDTVVGLEVGADDYITKPFDPRVLLARVNAVIRRCSADPAAEYTADTLILNVNQRCLENSKGKIPLNSRELDFITLLVESNTIPVSREVLSKNIFLKDWNPTDRAIDNFVARLRHKIELNPASPRYIVTVRQIGYMIPEGMISVAE